MTDQQGPAQTNKRTADSDREALPRTSGFRPDLEQAGRILQALKEKPFAALDNEEKKALTAFLTSTLRFPSSATIKDVRHTVCDDASGKLAKTHLDLEIGNRGKSYKEELILFCLTDPASAEIDLNRCTVCFGSYREYGQGIEFRLSRYPALAGQLLTMAASQPEHRLAYLFELPGEKECLAVFAGKSFADARQPQNHDRMLKIKDTRCFKVSGIKSAPIASGTGHFKSVGRGELSLPLAIGNLRVDLELGMASLDDSRLRQLGSFASVL